MLTDKQKLYLKLAEKNGWDIEKVPIKSRFDTPYRIHAGGISFPLSHPFPIHLELYKQAEDPESRFNSVKAAHDLIWPKYAKTWNHWDEIRFRAHCEGYEVISMAGGGGIGKSDCAARIGTLFWLAAPKSRACIISSVTLDSLETRIWGYAHKLVTELNAFPIAAAYRHTKPPKIIHPSKPPKIYGMFATAVREGEDNKTLSTLIGRHPEDGVMIILDEATDMSTAVIGAFKNLKKGTKFFQAIAIGNSCSKSDLHGALSTPKKGWDSIDPMRDKVWETTQPNGICLYFNPYDSPAIVEKDPEKKAIFSEFYITEEEIEASKREDGENSANFYRFTLGFWKRDDSEKTIASEQFLTEHQVRQATEWSGIYPQSIVAGLDPAFGGDGCVLRLAVLGHSVTGPVVIDYKNTELLFHIKIDVTADESTEYQLAAEIVRILKAHNCPVSNVAIDATGSGRALGELIRIISGEDIGPLKIISTGGAAQGMKGFQKKAEDPLLFVATPTILWMKFREFIQNSQIKGLDNDTVFQLINRLIETNDKTGKTILETKKSYKSRMTAQLPSMARSPDEADAAILCLHAAIIKQGFFPGQKHERVGDFKEDEISRKYWIWQHEQKEREAARTEQIKRAPLIASFSSGIEDLV